MNNKLSKKDIIEIFNKLLILRNFKFKQEKTNEFWNQITKDIEFFIKNEETLLNNYNEDFRYKDYYDYNQAPEYTISMLDTLEFTIFCLADELDVINYIISDDSFNEQEKQNILQEVNFSKISYFANHAKQLLEKKIQNTKKDISLPFEEDAKYKIFFTGYFLEDIKSLPKDVAIKVINKLSNPLSKNIVIRCSETIDHVKDKYKIPMARIQVSNDYRIAYIRYKNATIVLGVTLKSGKDNDYYRYDTCANKMNEIYMSADEFLEGTITSDNKDAYKYLRKIYGQWLERKTKSEKELFIRKKTKKVKYKNYEDHAEELSIN